MAWIARFCVEFLVSLYSSGGEKKCWVAVSAKVLGLLLGLLGRNVAEVVGEQVFGRCCMVGDF